MLVHRRTCRSLGKRRSHNFVEHQGLVAVAKEQDHLQERVVRYCSCSVVSNRSRYLHCHHHRDLQKPMEEQSQWHHRPHANAAKVPVLRHRRYHQKHQYHHHAAMEEGHHDCRH